MTLTPAQRLRVMQGAILFVVAVLGVRVAAMQWFDPVIPPDYGDGLAPRLLEVEPPRGLIVDRHGEVLARNTPEFRVHLIPGELPDAEDARRRALLRLEEVLGVPYAELEAAATSRLAVIDPYAPILVKDGLDQAEAIALRASAAGHPGVRVVASPSRVYADEASLAHILGYVGSIPEEEVEALIAQGYPLDGSIGLMGVEAAYEDALRGEPGRRLVLSDPQGREVEPLAELGARPGADLVLSLDLGLQRATAAALAEGMERGLSVVRHNTGQARPAPIPLGAAVLMDVHTGELLASVSLPSYDPNLFVDGDSEAIADIFTDRARPLIDRTYMEVRSPGSIYKPLVALAALEEGIATANTHIFSRGAITIPDQYNPGVVYVFRDWMAHGNLDMRGALARSSDEYFYHLVGGYQDFVGMGPDVLAAWSRKAGLGRPTGYDLPGEASGLVPDRRWKEAEFGEQWLLGDSYPYSIGQGYLTVTPLQMAVMTAAIANGGRLVEPRIVHGLREGGLVHALPPAITGRLEGSEAHYDVVREGMLAAAADGGTAATGRPAGQRIAGKTGTAEFGLPYPDGEFDTHGWYIGYAPYDEPEVAVVVFLEYGVGATHAGPVAREILEAYFAQRDAPDAPDASGSRVEARR
ncbi:MAG: penicillin-binding protein 2 [Dehalococcoidia bacterium]|nr:penicillin-binding protein 2 [Dehalococcoidia bacterium]